MGMLARGVLSTASVLVFTLLVCTHEVACEPVRGGELCRNSAGREECVAASAAAAAAAAKGEEDCVWCDLPQRCVPASRVRELGAASCFSTSRLREQSWQLLDQNECFSIASKDLCSSLGYCKWCRSEVLDDTCFGAAEAARLPRTIFLCSGVY